jgi:hypothetical protein
VSRRQMQRSGRTSLTRPTCYRRTLAQVIEAGISKHAYVGLWHEPDLPGTAADVCSSSMSGPVLDLLLPPLLTHSGHARLKISTVQLTFEPYFSDCHFLF